MFLLNCSIGDRKNSNHLQRKEFNKSPMLNSKYMQLGKFVCKWSGWRYNRIKCTRTYVETMASIGKTDYPQLK